MDSASLDLSGSLSLLFPNIQDKDNIVTSFMAMGTIQDPYKHLSAEERQQINDRLQLVSNKVKLYLDEYNPNKTPIEPDLKDISITTNTFEVLKKLPNYEIGDIVNASDLINLEFLLKFNIIKEV